MPHKLADKRDSRNPNSVVPEDLPIPASGSQKFYDMDLPGFGCRVTAAGARSFILNYRTTSGRERRYTIGAVGPWTVAAARVKANELKRRIRDGGDPLEELAADRAAPTMADLCSRYDAEHLPRKRASSQRNDRAMIARHILPELKHRKVAEVTHDDVDRLHRKISREAPYQANRAVALLSKMFSLAIRWGWRPDNPVKGIERNQEIKRTRYLSGAEIAALARALDEREASDPVSVEAIRLLLLTGARRGEVLGATWDQFDLEAGTWTKPGATTKQKTEHRVPLSAAARQLLGRLRECAPEGAKYVFPGNANGTKPLKDPKRFWTSVTKAASVHLLRDHPDERVRSIVTTLEGTLGRMPHYRECLGAAAALGVTLPPGLTDARMHDLRHTYASLLVSSGKSLPLIGALLGHTNPTTTARYAHLLDDAQREATETVGALVTGKPTAVVADIRGARK